MMAAMSASNSAKCEVFSNEQCTGYRFDTQWKLNQKYTKCTDSNHYCNGCALKCNLGHEKYAFNDNPVKQNISSVSQQNCTKYRLQ